MYYSAFTESRIRGLSHFCTLFNLMADSMFSGMKLGLENQFRIHKNESNIILFSKPFWGEPLPTPLPPSSQLASTPLKFNFRDKYEDIEIYNQFISHTYL